MVFMAPSTEDAGQFPVGEHQDGADAQAGVVFFDTIQLVTGRICESRAIGPSSAP